jgi:hypothetical protein
MTSRDAFGPELRRQRERRGVTLESIARTTKIPLALLDALERGDLSHWPHGMYRRTFFRAYLQAIDLPADPLLIDLIRLFPESGDPAGPIPDEDTYPRLTLDPVSPWHERVRRIGAAVADAAFVTLLAIGASLALATTLWPILGAIAVPYYAIGTVCLGGSPSAWCLTPGRFTRRTHRLTFERSDLTPIRGDWISNVLGSSLSSIRPAAPDASLERTA